MSRQGGFAQITQQKDGTRVAVWGIYKLYSAFQPIFAFNPVGKLEIMAFECLIRPFRQGVPVSPYKFFSSIPPEERVEVETLMRNLHLLNAGAFIDPSALIFVNFDPSQFAKKENVEDALRGMRLVLHQTNIDPSRIVCELTEQKSASPLALKNLMMALRDHGFRIAVDDFGAEDSDFDRIIQMNPDIVKFDAGWVVKLLRSAAGYALLKSMITKISERGIQTVIEGVEEPWQLELSEKAGAFMVQGFGIAKPQIAPTAFTAATAGNSSAPNIPEIEEPTQLSVAHGGLQSVFGRRR